jgi:ABC-type glycerol-3-phosphate transport system substrate-binding protein
LRKSLAVFTVVLLVMSLLSACTKTQTNTNDKQSSQSPEGTAKSSQSPETTAKGKEVKFEILHLMQETGKRKAIDEWLKTVGQKYLEATGNTVKWTVNSLVGTTYYDNMKMRLAAGDVPDMFWKGNDFIDGGYAAPLNDWDFVKQVKAKSKDTIKELTYPKDNNIYGIPFDRYAIGLLYNVKMLEKDGLKPPTTHSDLLKIMKHYEDNGKYAFVRAYATHFNRLVEFYTRFTPYMIKENPNFFTNIMSGKIVASSYDKWNNAWHKWGEVLTMNREDDMGNDEVVQNQRFANEQYPMIITGTWAISEITKFNPNLELGFTAVPMNDDANKQQIQMGHDGIFFVSKKVIGTDKEVIAKMLTDHIVSDEGINQWVTNALTPPALNFEIAGKINPLYKQLNEMLQNGQVNGSDGTLPLTGEFDTAINEFYSEFASMKDHSPAAVDAFIKKIDKKFAEIRSRQ